MVSTRGLVSSQCTPGTRTPPGVWLAAMIVLAFQSRSLLARLLLGDRKLAPVLARRAYKRR